MAGGDRLGQRRVGDVAGEVAEGEAPDAVLVQLVAGAGHRVST